MKAPIRTALVTDRKKRRAFDKMAKSVRRYVEYLDNDARILHLSMEGIGSLRRLPSMIEWSHRVDEFLEKKGNGEDTPPLKDATTKAKELEAAKRKAGFAEEESKRGFPTLHSHALVSLWGCLEWIVRDICADIVREAPFLLDEKRSEKVSVSLTTFFSMETKRERVRFLVEEIERREASKKRRGVDRFESLLCVLGLDGAVEKPVRDDIFELQQVRNVVVHAGGLADRKFVEMCPRRKERIGEPVCVTHEDYLRYREAVEAYLFCILGRCKVVLLGHNPSTVLFAPPTGAETGDGGCE
jgi:hypothetical protein